MDPLHQALQVVSSSVYTLWQLLPPMLCPCGGLEISLEGSCALRRFPVMLCPLAGENGGDGEAGGSAQPLVQITLVKQGGGARGQVYYPFISFRIARTLQVSCL